VIERADTDEHTGWLTAEVCRVDAGVRKSLPANLQNEALLRISLLRLGWGEAEEIRVKLLD
jgi:hypothetical protein